MARTGSGALERLIKNVRVVRPGRDDPQRLDIGIAGGRFTRIERDIPAEQALEVVDGRGWLAFPRRHWIAPDEHVIESPRPIFAVHVKAFAVTPGEPGHDKDRRQAPIPPKHPGTPL